MKSLVAPHPFQLNTKSDNADIEVMLVTATAGLCDVISKLLIITSFSNSDVERNLGADKTLNKENKSRIDNFLNAVNLQITGGVLKLMFCIYLT